MSAQSDLRKAGARYRKARGQLSTARAEIRTSVEAARSEGMTLAAIAAEVGISRQRVMQILRGDNGESRAGPDS